MSKTNEIAPQLLTVAETAKLLSLGQRTVFKWSSSGEHRFPKPIRLGRILRFRRTDIDRWVSTGINPQNQ